MASGTITVGRRQYASGLYWENSPSGRIAQAAKEAARQPGSVSEFFTVRAGDKGGRVPQFGLAPGGVGFKTGLPVLAACLANQQPGSWAGAFRLREGVAVVVVRDDLIVPDGDLFYVDETEARDRLLQEMALGGLQKIYAPESWGVSGADSMPLSLLLNDHAEVKLRSVEITQGAKMAIAGALFIVLAVLGIGWYIQQEREREETERSAQLEAVEKARLEAQKLAPVLSTKAPEYPPPDRKWEKVPTALEMIEICQEALKKVPLAAIGWKMAGAKCEGSSFNVRWTRTGGFSLAPEKASVNETGMVAFLTIPLRHVEPRGPEQLADPDVITSRYLKQNWPGALRRAQDDPLPGPPPGYQGDWNPPPAPWVKRSFTVSSPVLPWSLPTFFEGLPGVIISSLSLSGAGNHDSWTVDGVIYENRR